MDSKIGTDDNFLFMPKCFSKRKEIRLCLDKSPVPSTVLCKDCPALQEKNMSFLFGLRAEH